MPKTTAYDREPYGFGDMMTVEEFVEAAREHRLMDCDGSGHPIQNGRMSIINIVPSHLLDIPDDATHIQWYAIAGQQNR